MQTIQKASTLRSYGEPDTLVCEEVKRPLPGEDEVLIGAHTAGASIEDHHARAVCDEATDSRPTR